MGDPADAGPPELPPEPALEPEPELELLHAAADMLSAIARLTQTPHRPLRMISPIKFNSGLRYSDSGLRWDERVGRVARQVKTDGDQSAPVDGRLSPSPPTARVVNVLGLLGGRPRQRLSLADIVRSTDLSQATVLRILETLCQHGFVTRRESDKSYSLGPALIGLGYAARIGFASIELARPLLEEAAARLGLGWTVSAVVGDEIVVLDSSDEQHPGLRYPFAPPSGVIFVAWDTDQAINAWLARPPLVPTLPERRRLRAVINDCRQRGYVVEQLNDATIAGYSLLAGFGDRNLPASVREALGRAVSILGQRDYVLREVESSKELAVSLIAAPVFDAAGHPELLVSFIVNRARISSSRVRAFGSALRDIAQQVTSALGGQDPWLASPRRAFRGRQPTSPGG